MLNPIVKRFFALILNLWCENHGSCLYDLKPYYRIVDNASAVPSDTSTEVLHEGNVEKGNIYLGIFQARLCRYERNLKYIQKYRATNSVNFNALVMAKYVNGAFCLRLPVITWFFATFNRWVNSWT